MLRSLIFPSTTPAKRAKKQTCLRSRLNLSRPATRAVLSVLLARHLSLRRTASQARIRPPLTRGRGIPQARQRRGEDMPRKPLEQGCAEYRSQRRGHSAHPAVQRRTNQRMAIRSGVGERGDEQAMRDCWQQPAHSSPPAPPLMVHHHRLPLAAPAGVTRRAETPQGAQGGAAD